MTVPKKYIGLSLNEAYVEYLEGKLQKVQAACTIAEDWCKDQSNGMPDSTICISAMRDIRRHVKI